MNYTAVVLSVADVKAARGFYEDLFGLEVCQDYGINVSFTCGLSLQQEFDWLVGLQKERIGKKSNNMELCFETEDLDHFLEQLRRYPGAERLGDVVEHGWGQRVVRFYDLDGHLVEVGEDMGMVVRRFLRSGMTMEEVSNRMDVSMGDLKKLLERDTGGHS